MLANSCTSFCKPLCLNWVSLVFRNNIYTYYTVGCPPICLFFQGVFRKCPKSSRISFLGSSFVSFGYHPWCVHLSFLLWVPVGVLLNVLLSVFIGVILGFLRNLLLQGVLVGVLLGGLLGASWVLTWVSFEIIIMGVLLGVLVVSSWVSSWCPQSSYFVSYGGHLPMIYYCWKGRNCRLPK